MDLVVTDAEVTDGERADAVALSTDEGVVFLAFEDADARYALQMALTRHRLTHGDHEDADE